MQIQPQMQIQPCGFYDLVVIDDEGMMGIEMGLTGVPETFVVNEEGKIIYRIVGPINNENKF